MSNIKQHHEVSRIETQLELDAKKLIEAHGIDTKALKNYFFGKGLAYAICYGSSLSNAKHLAMTNISKMSFLSVASKRSVIQEFIKNPDKYTCYDELVKLVYAGDLVEARKFAARSWARKLEVNIAEDTMNLALLLTDSYVDTQKVRKFKEGEVNIGELYLRYL